MGVSIKEDVELNEKQFKLLRMIYTSDINAEKAMEMLEDTREELEKIVNELVQYKILRVTGEDEVEITEKGTKYVEQMKKNIDNESK